MKPIARHLSRAILSILIVTTIEGCGVMHEITSVSYRAVTAPAKLFTRHDARPAPGTRVVTTTVITRRTRVTTPLAANSPPPSHRASSRPQHQRVATTSSSASSAKAQRMRPSVDRTAPKNEPKIAQKSKQPQSAVPLPTAQRVPEKPGYVISPFDPKKRYVDVSGYTPGSKVKDPWTDKIFIVP